MSRESIVTVGEFGKRHGLLESSSMGVGLKTFFEQEKLQWPELLQGSSSLNRCEYREISLDGELIEAQYNPIREKSVVAEVDAASIKERGCFLCLEALPAHQTALKIYEHFVALCNPRPVFDLHFTISSTAHTAQDLTSSLSEYLAMTRLVSPEFLIFFNGAKCGASAPDHLHFQAVPADSFRMFNSYMKASETLEWHMAKGCQVSLFSKAGIDFVVCKGTDLSGLRNYLEDLFKLHSDTMVSMASYYSGDSWHIMIVLRKAHRPRCYFESGDKKQIFGTATIELFGRIVVPYLNDFKRLDSSILSQAFYDVVCQREVVDRIVRDSLT